MDAYHSETYGRAELVSGSPGIGGATGNVICY